MKTESIDIAKSANKLTGTAVEMAARLRDLIPSIEQLPSNASPAERRDHRLLEESRSLERRALKYRLAFDFGKQYGWKQSSREFTPMVLARGGVWDRECYGARGLWPREFADHPYFYRMGRNAAALASHPYDVTKATKIAAKAWAEANGLTVAFPDDFPSWWFPGDTTLVVFTRAQTGR